MRQIHCFSLGHPDSFFLQQQHPKIIKSINNHQTSSNFPYFLTASTRPHQIKTHHTNLKKIHRNGRQQRSKGRYAEGTRREGQVQEG
jgi:hypothetical protein